MSERRHCIRLWGPWQVHAIPANDDFAAHESRLNFKSLQAEVESPWSDDFARNFLGTLTLSRKFNRPTGLEFDQKVTLEMELFVSTCIGTVVLNHSSELGATSRGLQEFELELREGSNQIDLVFSIGAAMTEFRLPPFKVMQLCIKG